MFSQYSWGDYIKFVILITALYYAFVGWKYYRQDILDWFGNFGKKDQSAPAAAINEQQDEDDADDSDLYSVKSYSTGAVAPTTNNGVDYPDPLEDQESDTADDEPQLEPHHQSQVSSAEVEISDGVVVADQPTESFELGLATTPVRPAERSLADVINAARRMSADEKGAFSPNSPDDDEAAELAGQLNEQKGFGSVLSGVSFNR